jgi:DNA polymerase III subunit gamma/tau
MTYLVLARKWRPQTWNELVGQDHVTATLRNAIQHQRIGHAYLLTGPRGVGKTSAARIFAKALNCEKGPIPDPCNVCAACQSVTAGNHMDVVEIDGASNNGVDDIRSLRETVRYAPAHGRYRVYIIDEVHMLSTSAFNALLKTLEEPPEHAIFIFATTEPHKVPATIVSRCQRFDFHRVGTAQTTALLRRICDAEGITAEDGALHLIARKAEGSLRDSQSLLDQLVSFTGGAVRAEDVVRAMGLIDQQLFFDATDAAAGRDEAKSLDLAERIATSGANVEEFLAGLSEHLRNLLVTRAVGRTDTLDLPESERVRIAEKAGDFEEDDLLRMLRIVADAQGLVRHSPTPRIPLELCLVKMARMDRMVGIAELLQGMRELRKSRGAVQDPPVRNSGPSLRPAPEEKRPPARNQEPAAGSPAPSAGNPRAASQSPGPSVQTRPEPPDRSLRPSAADGATNRPPEAPVPFTIETVKARWEDILNRVKEKTITTGSFLEEGTPSRVIDDTLEVGFAQCNGFHADSVMRAQPVIQEVLMDVFGRRIAFRCVKGDFPVRKRLTDRERQREAIEKLGEKGTSVRRILDDFEADVEP